MTKTHFGQHEDCFGCRVQSVSIAASAMPSRSPHAASTNAMEKRWEADMPAYKRLRDNGLQPANIDGCSIIEKRATESIEVERGLMGKYAKRMAQAAAEIPA